MRKWRRVWIGWVITGCFALSAMSAWGAQTEAIEKDLKRKKRDLSNVRKELSLTRDREKEVRGKESSVLERLSTIDTDLQKKEKDLKEMEGQLTQIKDQREATKNQLAVLNEEMGRTRGELLSRLRGFYKMSRVSPETLLVASRSYPDLMRVDKYLKAVIGSDTRMLENHRGQFLLKERARDELTRNQVQWQRAMAAVEKKKEEVEKVRQQQRVLLKSIQNQKVVYQKVIDELEHRARELQGFVEKLEKEKSALAYARPKGEPSRGRLIAPVEGKVITLFKERGQNGIEIKAPLGSEIRAVLPGRVLYSDWFKGFGNLVIIDHGDHLYTVSGYSSQLLKKEGEIVAQGETVALVGSAGSLKGPCLYFEVRRHGKPEDPIQWLPQMDKVVSVPDGAKEKGKKEM
jgi:murein hydrolase activator